MATIATTDIVDERTGEVIAEAGQELDDETLYRLEMIAADVEPLTEYRPLPCPYCGHDLIGPMHALIDGEFICQRSYYGA